MKEIESPVVFDINAALAETAAAEAEKTAFRPPLHVHTDIEPTFLRSRRNSIGNDSLEVIRQDWVKTVTEFEKQLEMHRKRFEVYYASCRTLIDDLKRLGGQ